MISQGISRKVKGHPREKGWYDTEFDPMSSRKSVSSKIIFGIINSDDFRTTSIQAPRLLSELLGDPCVRTAPSSLSITT